MEIERSIRNADNRVIAGMLVVFVALVVLIGIASNDVPGEVESTQPSFDVAPAASMLPTSPDAATSEPRPVPVAKVAAHRLAATPPTAVQSGTTARARPVERKVETWFADESAKGMRPDAPR